MLFYLLDQEEKELIYFLKKGPNWSLYFCLPLFYLYLLV